MGDLIRLLLDLIKPLSPFRVVNQWERGLYMVVGIHRGTVGPGLKVVVPYVCDVIPVSVVPEVYTTPLQTATLRNGEVLTYSASLTVIVTDPADAFLKLGHYTETVTELAASVLSEGLADAEPERFDPARGKRDRLLAELRAQINDALAGFGLTVTALRLPNCARGLRTLRLLTDRATFQPTPVGVAHLH